jgi:DNA-binding NtrC family response regulator
VVRRAVMFCPDPLIRPEDLDLRRQPAKSQRPSDGDDVLEKGDIEPYKDAKERLLHRFTLKYVSDLLEKTNGNVTRAAELSGLSRVAVQKIMLRLDFTAGSVPEGDTR